MVLLHFTLFQQNKFLPIAYSTDDTSFVSTKNIFSMYFDGNQRLTLRERKKIPI